MPIIISNEARQIDEYVQRHLDYSLSYVALLVITLMLINPSLTNRQIADRLHSTQTLVDINEDTVKSTFNYNREFISQAIFQATGNQVTVRKKSFKNTMKRHIFMMNESDIIGILENYKNNLLVLSLGNQLSCECAEIIRKVCQEIIDMIDNNEYN